MTVPKQTKQTKGKRMKINKNQSAITDVSQLYTNDNSVVNILEVNVKGMPEKEATEWVTTLKQTILKEQPKISLVLIPVCD